MSMNVFLWTFTSVLCLFNRGCQENLVRLHPIHPWEAFFSARSPSMTTAAVCWRSRCGQTLGMLNFLGNVITTTWREREYHSVLFEEEKDLKACVQGRNIYTLIQKWRMLLGLKKEVGWESSPKQLPARNSITTVCAWVKGREKERGCNVFVYIVFVSDVCQLFVWSLFFTLITLIGVANLF